MIFSQNQHMKRRIENRIVIPEAEGGDVRSSGVDADVSFFQAASTSFLERSYMTVFDIALPRKANFTLAGESGRPPDLHLVCIKANVMSSLLVSTSSFRLTKLRMTTACHFESLEAGANPTISLSMTPRAYLLAI